MHANGVVDRNCLSNEAVRVVEYYQFLDTFMRANTQRFPQSVVSQQGGAPPLRALFILDDEWNVSKFIDWNIWSNRSASLHDLATLDFSSEDSWEIKGIGLLVEPIPAQSKDDESKQSYKSGKS